MRKPPPPEERLLQKKSISLPPAVWGRIDAIARKEHMDAGELIRWIITSYAEDYEAAETGKKGARNA